METYCIRPDYKPNSIATSFDDASQATYWTPHRLEQSRRFQFDVYSLALKIARETNAKSLVDIGSGPAEKLRHLDPSVFQRVHLMDQPSVSAMVEERMPFATFVPIDLENSAVDNQGTFDIVICADVLEHLQDPTPCTRSIHSLLAPEGLAFISTPERDIVRGPDCLECGNPAHVREWNMDEFAAFLTGAGLEVIEHLLMPQKRLPAAEDWLRRRLGARIRSRRWSGCQLAICRRAKAIQ